MQRDARGVSSVIGNVLLVAVTVILAAVLATYAFGVGNDVSQPGPTTTIDIRDAPESVDTREYQSDEFIEIAHSGGDALQLSELSIKIRDGETNDLVAGWDGSDWTTPPSSVELVEFANAGVSSEFTVGDQLSIDIKDNGDLLAGEYTVEVTHPESGSVIGSDTLTVS